MSRTPLTLVFDTVRAEVARYARLYTEARTRCAAFAPYETAIALEAAVDPSSPLPYEARDALVLAILEEQQRAPHPLWQSLMLTAFRAILRRIRRRLGRPGDEDADQSVLVAFLSALHTVKPGRYAGLGLRWAVEKVVFPRARPQKNAPPLEPFDDDTYCGDVFGVDAVAQAAAAEVVRLLDGQDQLLDVLLATRAGDESLKDYVIRSNPGATRAERDAEYERLLRARLGVERDLRARLGVERDLRARLASRSAA